MQAPFGNGPSKNYAAALMANGFTFYHSSVDHEAAGSGAANLPCKHGRSIGLGVPRIMFTLVQKYLLGAIFNLAL